LFVSWKPSRSGYSGCAMTVASLSLVAKNCNVNGSSFVAQLVDSHRTGLELASPRIKGIALKKR
jgi:hypothetical protein